MGGLKTRANAHIHALWANSSQEEQAREDVERRSERATKQTPVSLAVAEDLTRDRDDAHARAPGEPERAREVVARGASRLEFLAGRIADADWRARFLVEVPTNRRLIELDGEGES